MKLYRPVLIESAEQAENAIRDGRKLDPHLIHAMTTGVKA